MKILAIVFILLCFSLGKVLYYQVSEETPSFIFPTLASPDIEFEDLSGGCGGFTDCIEYLAEVIKNIGLAITFVVLFIINLLVFLFLLFDLLLEVAFSGIEGAPFWVNVILTTLQSGMIVFIIYRMVRKGESND